MSTYPKYTSRDLESLPDVEGTRYEIIDGDLFVSKPHRLEHQWSCSMLGAALHQWGMWNDTGYAVLAPGLIFDPNNDVAPDVVWISKSRLSKGRNSDGHLTVAPELVAEVLSPGSANERRDREFKLRLYSRQGVSEYWIVDWQQRSVQVFRRGDLMLRLVATLWTADTLTSPLLPGFELPVANLWEPAA